MEVFVHVARLASPSVAGALVASVWQGLLLTGGVGLAMRGVRGASAGARTWVWRAVLLLVLGLPVLVLLGPHGQTLGHRGLHVGSGWSLALLVVWAMGSAWRGFGLGRDAFRLRRLARRAVPVAVAGELGALLAGSRRAELCVSAEVNRPSVTGLLRPRLLLPEGLLESMSASELEHVVRHEVEHLRRWDDWFNLLQGIGLVVFPLNPALVWLDRRLCRERELACDDGVLRATRAGKAYAACLVKLAEDSLGRKGLALALSALGTRARESELPGRVRRILAGPERVDAGVRVPVAVAALIGASVAGAVLLAGGPQWLSFDAAASTVTGVVAPVAVEAEADLASIGRLSVAMKRQVGRPRMIGVALVRPGAPGRVAGTRGIRRKTPLRVPGVKAGVASRMALARISVRSAARDVPGLRTAAESGDVPSGHFAVTEFELSQPMYAAVPWGGGWLIVQL